MARDTKWCQNPKCPKENSNQLEVAVNIINLIKRMGMVVVISVHLVVMMWSSIYLDRAIDAIGARITEPVKVNMENAWEVKSEYVYNRGDDTRSRYIYFLTNKFFNVRHPITMVQALGHIPTDDNYWNYYQTIPSAQAKELAQQLGLTSKQ